MPRDIESAILKLEEEQGSSLMKVVIESTALFKNALAILAGNQKPDYSINTGTKIIPLSRGTGLKPINPDIFTGAKHTNQVPKHDTQISDNLDKTE